MDIWEILDKIVIKAHNKGSENLTPQQRTAFLISQLDAELPVGGGPLDVRLSEAESRLQQLEEHGVMADTNSSGTGRPSPRKYPPELKQRAIRMVLDSYDRGEERCGTITRIADELDIGPESLRRWVVQAEIDRGQRAGTTSEEAQRIAELERENRELRRANEILKSAAAFFGAELDRQSKK